LATKKIPDSIIEEQEKNIDPKKIPLLKKTKVDKIETGSFTFPEEEKKVAVNTDLTCSCCGQLKEEKEFYRSFSIANKARGKSNLCSSCIDAIWASYLARFSNDLKRSLYYFCILIDIPFFKNIIEEISPSGNNQSFIKKYIARIISIGSINGEVVFLDGQLLWDGTNEKDPNFFDYDAEEVTYAPTKEDVRYWGKIPPNDIYFLKQEFEDWRKRYELKEKNMEEIVKQICFKQLRIHRLNEANQNTSKELTDLQNLMTTANLKPVQNKGIGTEENCLGNWIKRFENERPIPAPDPVFEDVDGIWKKIRIWFLGHFSKVFNYENEYSREYEQEMAKYRVEIKEDYETKKATSPMGKELFK